jgi:hypothetical protein
VRALFFSCDSPRECEAREKQNKQKNVSSCRNYNRLNKKEVTAAEIHFVAHMQGLATPQRFSIAALSHKNGGGGKKGKMQHGKDSRG